MELEASAFSLDTLNEEKIRLLREIAQLKTNKGSANPELSHHDDIENNDANIVSLSDKYYLQPSNHPKSAGEIAMSSIGSLRVYEMMLGLCFITIILNWILMPWLTQSKMYLIKNIAVIR